MTRRLALYLAILVAWAPSLGAPFVYDDRIEVVGNRTIRSLGALGAIAGYNTSRPLLIATWAVEWRLFGLDPLGYHVVSLLVHGLNAGLVGALLGRWMSPSRAALLAALWALHPLTTEGVSYITGRSDALVATFALGALIAWVDHLRGIRGPGLAVALVGAGLLTKETAVAIPVVLWAAGRFVEGRASSRRVWAPFAGLLGVAIAVRLAVYGWPAAEATRAPLDQLGGQALAWTHGLQLWILPFGQSILHDHGVPRLPLALALLSAWVAAGVLAARRGGLVAFGAALWIAVLLPASILPMKEWFPEHRTYLAGLGPLLVAGALLPDRRVRPAWGLLPLLFGATLLRNRVWTDEIALWGGAAAHCPRSADAAYAHGDALRLAGRAVEAEAAYRRSLELAPDRLDTKVNLGIARAEQGDADGARALWREVLRVDPTHCAAHNDLAGLDARAGRLSQAAAGYLDTLAWCPDDPLAHLNLGNLHVALGDSRKATLHYRAYLAAAPAGPGADAARQGLTRLGAGAP